MPMMKDSGTTWLGLIPASWKLKRGKYLFVQRNERGNAKCLQLLSPTQKYGVIPQSLYEELTGMNAVKLNDKTDFEQLKTIHKGDFCISLRSFQGGFEYCQYEGVVSPAYQVFHKQCELYDGYYKYLFKEQGFIGKMNSYTLSLRDGKNIAFDDFGDTYIPVPSLPDQQAIADYLDTKCAEIDALSADIQAQIDTLEEYKRSVITEAVTHGLNHSVGLKNSRIDEYTFIPEHWNISRLSYECYIRARLGWKGLKADEYVDEGYAFISAFNIQNGTLEWSPLNFITQERYDESPEIKIRIGDVLIVKDGAGVGKCARVDDLPMGETAPNSSIAVISSLGNVEYRFTCYYLQSTIFSNFVNTLYNGMGVPHLTQEVLKTIKMPIPPYNEQKQIADYLDRKVSDINATISAKQEQLTVLDEYKKSTIYEYVTGKKEVPTYES